MLGVGRLHQAVLAETEISWSVGGGLADDEVVHEVELEELSAVVEPAGELAVGGAWGGVAAGVIVDEDEAPCAAADDWEEDLARVGAGFGEGAAADFLDADEGAADGEEDDFEDFCGFEAEGGADEAVDGVWFVERDRVPFFGGEAAADFEGCGEEEGFDFADGALVCEVLP